MTNRENASALLLEEWNTWCDAHEATKVARAAYERKASELHIGLCDCCSKPMPAYDHSQQCDGCHLPWGWDTPEGRRKARAAELDAQIERLRAERSKLK